VAICAFPPLSEATPITAPFAVKVIVPEGGPTNEDTEAVKVTDWPCADGFREEATVVADGYGRDLASPNGSSSNMAWAKATAARATRIDSVFLSGMLFSTPRKAAPKSAYRAKFFPGGLRNIGAAARFMHR
jgi:hypothetical protein